MILLFTPPQLLLPLPLLVLLRLRMLYLIPLRYQHHFDLFSSDQYFSFSISELIECVPFDNKRLRCVLVVGRGFTRLRHFIFVDDSYFCGLLIQTKLLDINGKYSNSRITAITIIINI